MQMIQSWARVRGRCRDEVGLWRLRSEWRREARSSNFNARRTPPRRLLVLPGDPRTLVGSRGDEAMIQGVVQFMRMTHAELEVAVVTSSPEASAAAVRMGLQPLESWSTDFSLTKVLEAVDQFQPDAAVVVGGDVMDGYYNPATTTRLLAVADLLSRRGVPTSMLGFSFNERPHASLRSAYNSIGTTLRLNVRDPISFARFKRFTRTKAQLVADVAFLLPADLSAPGVAPVTQWVRQRHAAGDLVLGFNMHPMLIKHATQEQLAALVAAASTALINISKSRSVSWMLLAHDYRGVLSDDACLEPIARALDAASLSDRFHHVLGERTAAELKALAGLSDGVCTGRMHLAIASLGMGVPVTALTYQDKFEGLFRHFELPAWLLLTPEQAAKSAHLESTLGRFIDELDALRAQVEACLPRVRAASERNLTGLM